MGLTKKDLLRTGVDNQQALVSRLQRRPIQPVIHTIPGGKTLWAQVDADTMTDAIFTWLRKCRAFSEVTINFAANPESIETQTKKVYPFEQTIIPGTKMVRPVWEVNEKGKKYLAERLRDAIFLGPCVSVKATEEGVFVTTDPSGEFAPTRLVTEDDLERQAELLEEIKAEMEEEEEGSSKGVEDTLQLFALGDEIPSEAWEPHLVFLPTKKSEYGK